MLAEVTGWGNVLGGDLHVCVCLRACMCVCLRVCVCVCVCVVGLKTQKAVMCCGVLFGPRCSNSLFSAPLLQMRMLCFSLS